MSKVMHIDIDAYFASAEISRNPHLKDLPVCIVTKNNNGIVSAANYIARGYGIKAAMNTNIALNLNPNLIMIKSDLKYYKTLSNQFFEFLFNTLNSKMEVWSIDEGFIDVSDIIEQLYDGNDDLFVANLKYKIKQHFNFNVSIGIAQNKYIAKLLSDCSKPNGYLNQKNIDIYSFKINNMLYLNNDKIKKLNEKKIITIRDFFNENNHKTVSKIVSKSTLNKISLAFYQDKFNIEENLNRPNTISKSFKFNVLEYNLEIIEKQLLNLLDKLLLEKQNYYSNLNYTNIAIFYKKDNKTNKISSKIDSSISLRDNLLNLFNNKYKVTGIEIIGVSLSDLIDRQENIFDSYK